jgi:hypothetical protein
LALHFTPILLCPTKGQLWETMMGEDGQNTFGTCGIIISFYKLFDKKKKRRFFLLNSKISCIYTRATKNSQKTFFCQEMTKFVEKSHGVRSLKSEL